MAAAVHSADLSPQRDHALMKLWASSEKDGLVNALFEPLTLHETSLLQQLEEARNRDSVVLRDERE